jgi:DNA-binding GntR family transcriptional regulator
MCWVRLAHSGAAEVEQDRGAVVPNLDAAATDLGGTTMDA